MFPGEPSKTSELSVRAQARRQAEATIEASREGMALLAIGALLEGADVFEVADACGFNLRPRVEAPADVLDTGQRGAFNFAGFLMGQGVAPEARALHEFIGFLQTELSEFMYKAAGVDCG